mgnify:CR=1 FL=1
MVISYHLNQQEERTQFPKPPFYDMRMALRLSIPDHEAMKPREIIVETTSCTGTHLALVEHDGRYFLECEGRQIAASHLGDAARTLVETLSRPFRPARQPRLIFLGLGLGHALRAVQEALPQEKSSFVVFPEASELAEWLQEHLPDNPLDDERIHLEDRSPFETLSKKYSDSQAIVADLDHLDALAPKEWLPTSPAVLSNFHEHLKNGGLLGLISTRSIPGLEKALRKVGFEVAVDLIPLSEKSKKHRTLYLARKGHYQRSH